MFAPSPGDCASESPGCGSRDASNLAAFLYLLRTTDEPAYRRIVAAVRQVAPFFSAATRTQILVATQSITLIDQLDPSVVVIVDRAEGQSTFRRVAPEEVSAWEDEYALSEIRMKNVIGGRPQSLQDTAVHSTFRSP